MASEEDYGQVRVVVSSDACPWQMPTPRSDASPWAALHVFLNRFVSFNMNNYRRPVFDLCTDCLGKILDTTCVVLSASHLNNQLTFSRQMKRNEGLVTALISTSLLLVIRTSRQIMRWG